LNAKVKRYSFLDSVTDWKIGGTRSEVNCN